jgi:hypothetical protein
MLVSTVPGSILIRDEVPPAVDEEIFREEEAYVLKVR